MADPVKAMVWYLAALVWKATVATAVKQVNIFYLLAAEAWMTYFCVN